VSRDDAQIEVKRAGAAQKTPEKVSIFTLLLGDDGHPTARVLTTEEIVPPGRSCRSSCTPTWGTRGRDGHFPSSHLRYIALKVSAQSCRSTES
jgi:hypothetical protein